MKRRLEPTPDALLAVSRRLLADEMLGRLTRWLRVLGFDTEYAAGLEDALVLAWARRERRILLTRDTGIVCRRLVRRGEVEAVLIRDDRIADQLDQLVRDHGLARTGVPRCLVCNCRLRRAEPTEAAPRVPGYVAATQRSFRYCASCERYVWEGTHWVNMCAFLRGIGVVGA